MHINTELLSRIQFAFTISFHILFPSFSIGLVTFIAIMEGLWLKTKNQNYLQICRFWIKVFALTFGMGIVSGIVMEFQLGTNWSGFAQKVGDVLGPLFTYEVLTAFFIEAGFLGVMLFGWKRVGNKFHYLSTLLVLLGTTVSAFWIMSANSWMQYPAGAQLVGNSFIVTNWLKVIFNPTFKLRFLHMMLASYLAAAFIIAGIAAYYLLNRQHFSFAKTCFSFAITSALIISLLQAFVGDAVGLNVNRYQPIKVAAIEGLWHTKKGAPLVIFAIPDQAHQKNWYSLEIPHLASLLNTHQWNGRLIGLSSVSKNNQPFVIFVFYAFRLMVAMGLLMIFIAALGIFLHYKKRLYTSKWYLRCCLLMSPIGLIALWMGWIVAETGRQPWVVYGVLRTVDAASKVNMHDVLISLCLLVLVYGIIFGYFYFYYLFKIIRQGPLTHKSLVATYSVDKEK